MITKKELEQLRAQRSTPKPALEYNIDGPAHPQMAAHVAAQREREIREGERAMNDAKHDMRCEYELSRLRGNTKVMFNQSGKEIKP